MSAIALMRSIVVVLGLVGLAACAHRPGPGEVFRDCADCPEMVAIPAASIMPPERTANRSSRRPSFAISRTEVTFAQWDACVAAGGCNGSMPNDQGWGRDNRPVINVSWNDAQAYVRWLSRHTGQRYRLPSSDEWEVAARAGSTTYRDWGDQDPVCDESVRNGANFDSCTDDRTRPVGSFQPNAFGLYDMNGNVWEWVQDCWGECGFRYIRGGSWSNGPEILYTSNRYWNLGVIGFRDDVGFRVAKTL